MVHQIILIQTYPAQFGTFNLKEIRNLARMGGGAKTEVAQNRGLTLGLGPQIYTEIESIAIEIDCGYSLAKFALQHFVLNRPPS